MAVTKITFLTTLVLLLAAVLAAPAPEKVESEDLAASDKDDLKTAASHWGGHYGGYGGHYGYPGYYGSWGYPSYGYGYGWPYGGYGGYGGYGHYGGYGGYGYGGYGGWW